MKNYWLVALCGGSVSAIVIIGSICFSEDHFRMQFCTCSLLIMLFPHTSGPSDIEGKEK